jgi:hypothetical protein
MADMLGECFCVNARLCLLSFYYFWADDFEVGFSFNFFDAGVSAGNASKKKEKQVFPVFLLMYVWIFLVFDRDCAKCASALRSGVSALRSGAVYVL